MDAKPSPSPVALATVHCFLWTLFVVGMVTIVSDYRQQFMDWNLKVPAHTKWALEVSHWLANSWYFLVPALPLFFVLDAGILFLLHRNPDARSLESLWTRAMIATPLLLGSAAAFGIWKILENVLPGISK